jgi:hypothetical protein
MRAVVWVPGCYQQESTAVVDFNQKVHVTPRVLGMIHGFTASSCTRVGNERKTSKSVLRSTPLFTVLVLAGSFSGL